MEEDAQSQFLEDQSSPFPVELDLFQEYCSISSCDPKNHKINGNIYKPTKGSTELYQAIKSSDHTRIASLVEAYRMDFEKVKIHLVSKFGCDPKDAIWLKKTILIAATQEECREVTKFETLKTEPVNIGKAVLVLLQHPMQEKHVAVIHPDISNRLEACRLVDKLTRNGYLSWNSSGYEESFLEVAALRGNYRLIDLLYSYGARMDDPEHNPLLSAIRANQLETVQWLLTEHFDNFDCTKRDKQNLSALMKAMEKGNPVMFKYVLQKMIDYRMKYYNETKNEAFSSIFRFENDDLCSLSILTFLRSHKLRKTIEECIVEHELDLSYQWKNVTILESLLDKEVAVEYCLEQVRMKPTLLGLRVYNETTVLHKFIEWSRMDFLEEIYVDNAIVKKYFETKDALIELRKALIKDCHNKIAFMLKHHQDFLLVNEDLFRKTILEFASPSYTVHSRYIECVVRHFPQFKPALENIQKNLIDERIRQGLKTTYFQRQNTNDQMLEYIEGTLKQARYFKNSKVLHMAVQMDDIQLFDQLIADGYELDHVDDYGNHPVHYVGSTEMLDHLIRLHPDGKQLLNRTNTEGCTVLYRVCGLPYDGHKLLPIVEKLVEYGCDISKLNSNGETVLFLTTSITVVDYLRGLGASLDLINSSGQTILFKHLQLYRTCTVLNLLPLVKDLATFKETAHVYLPLLVRKQYHFTSFDYDYFLEEYPTTTKLLFDSLVKHSREEASRVFTLACYNSFYYIVQKFMQFDYDLNYNYQADYENSSILALLQNLHQQQLHVAQWLLTKSVNLKHQNAWGKSVLHFVIPIKHALTKESHVELILSVLEKGAPINAVDKDGNTPLHLAVKQKEWHLVELLVSNGADLKLKNNAGKIPLEIANEVTQELFYFMV
ncbi:putative ankyrin repeat protein RF_0381 [Uranotaenia lowii]|uniref:putative ankyrin repeat protein RF_0381 n=1 Tax=Uranotaenia lowii TaxID=190385 RepID=UPI00247A1E3B|nr:putative ankyrin repeat protein RF_0381 [Uranotaenia lowii]